MKRIILIGLTLLGIVALKAQSQDYDRQVGIDASKFLGQFLNFGGSGSSFSPYYLNYRKLGETTNTRMGFGANLDLQFNGSRSLSSIDFRIGKERFKDFGKKNEWRAFYGWDFKTGIEALFNNGNNNRSIIKFGLAPVLGLQFRINERITLSTETAYNIWLSIGIAEDENIVNLISDFAPPLSLFVQYDFFKLKKSKPEKM